MSKIKIEDIKKELEAQGWELVSEEYKNLDAQLTVRCPEGHTVYQPWKKLRIKPICPICAKNTYKTEAKETKIIPKQKGVQRILALDQATYTSGYSIYDGRNLIRYGTYNTSYKDDGERNHAIKVWLINMIANWKPDFIGLEGIQYQQDKGPRMGVTTFEILARLQGVLIECCVEEGIPYEICPTNTWRHACGVKGRARADKKKSAQLLAKQWYDISVTEDEADAIGIGKYLTVKSNIIREVSSWE